MLALAHQQMLGAGVGGGGERCVCTSSVRKKNIVKGKT